MPEFIELVKKMREAQRKYFRSRTGADLQRAKEAENAVDTWLQRNSSNAQEKPAPTLFS